jgi:hypothetical protein
MQQQLPFEAPQHEGSVSKEQLAGHISVVIQPLHIPGADRIEAVTWTLLTLRANLDANVKAFKVCP